MNKLKKYSPMQLIVLVTLRFLIGWHLFYEGISKLVDPGWTSAGFLDESQWILTGFAEWIVSNSSALSVVDFMNTWGLIAIGAGLILGLFTRIASISGAVLLLLYYFNNVPLLGLEYSVPSEGNYLIISKTLIESVTLIALAVFPTGRIVGLDIFTARIFNWK